jgi:uroporphyrinogen III methyltransferase/synthase
VEGSSLQRRRILVTRSAEQADALGDLLRARGAEPVIAPTIEFRPPADRGPLEAAFPKLGTYDWVVFTSRTAVDRFFAELAARGLDAGAISRARIATVGPATGAALEAVNLKVACLPDEHHGEGLAEAMAKHVRPGERVLLPRALVAREILPETLRAAGLEVDVLPVYETHRVSIEAFAPTAEALRRGAVDAVTFTSSSTVTHLAELLGPTAASDLAPLIVASIGPITTETANSLGIRVDVTAFPHTLPGLVAALESGFCR